MQKKKRVIKNPALEKFLKQRDQKFNTNFKKASNFKPPMPKGRRGDR